MTDRRDKLRGIVVSLPTPTRENYEVDYERFKEHVNWLIDQGLVEGKAVLMGGGGLGEGYFLTREEHERLMEVLVEAADGRVPTMTGIFESCSKEAVRRAKTAEDLGIDFLQVNPPHYLAPVDDEVYTHYKMINDSADVGIMVYNTPWCTMNYEIRPSLMERLAELENVVGVKWTSFDPINFVTMLKTFSKRLNFIDNSTLISLAYQLGAKGYISLLGNIAPKAELYLLNLLEKGEFNKFDREYKRLHAWREVLSSAEEMGYQGIGEGTISKAILEASGKPMGPPLPPQRRISREDLEKIKSLLQKCGALNLTTDQKI
ncbi:MAG: dihydrodipicolinate synthase [Candidatus Bathyarchaeota archaeon B26-2]|nr:MAG: dihydrodipicolinate synthase [Candidatus Bathyarchaeota archaeon B26-2]